MNWSPHVTVAAIIEKDGQFLLVEEKSSGKIVLNQPAGHWEEHETLADAASREVYEETAWRFVPEYLIGIYQWQHPGNKKTFLRFCFGGKAIEHDSHSQLDPDILRTVWLPYDGLLSEKQRHRSPMVMQCVDDYLAGQRYDLKLMQHIIQS